MGNTGKSVCAAVTALVLLAGCTAPTDPAPVDSTTGSAPAPSAPAEETVPAPVAAALDVVAADRKDDFSVAVQDNTTGRSWSYNPDARYLEASLVKVPILLTLVRQATEEDRSLTAEEEELATLMIEYSDNEATAELYARLGGRDALDRTYDLIGVTDTEAGEMWGASETTAGDQVLIARTAANGADWLDADLLAFAVGLMENVCPEQNWGISAGVSSPLTEVALKNGWLPDDDDEWAVGSSGFIRDGERNYSIAVLSSRNSTLSEGIGVVENVASVINGYEAGA
ncbi:MULTISPECIES: serine hydrolase [unclassified Arthrobacter]|uniref:serine hydrolase n=1 Tax=unclassified Arthrobacter TaxID=235627 RepID=UPI001E3F4A7A|nr:MULTISPECIES: serine hydrolase [unclassified Arthrobacter]MCC9145693.1 class A beta-lactamase-related serine hydrolase [Arthrobacter sp. zg-Y919]MDK1276922.1 serine hydrolase [Arthrobacter sp. zg.Y919]WIB04147.1 serine hydrolase [Arthrobacter sp. zg-Y919]